VLGSAGTTLLGAPATLAHLVLATVDERDALASVRDAERRTPDDRAVVLGIVPLIGIIVVGVARALFGRPRLGRYRVGGSQAGREA
jgi:hypothetical protein